MGSLDQVVALRDEAKLKLTTQYLPI